MMKEYLSILGDSVSVVVVIVCNDMTWQASIDVSSDCVTTSATIQKSHLQILSRVLFSSTLQIRDFVRLLAYEYTSWLLFCKSNEIIISKHFLLSTLDSDLVTMRYFWYHTFTTTLALNLQWQALYAYLLESGIATRSMQ